MFPVKQEYLNIVNQLQAGFNSVLEGVEVEYRVKLITMTEFKFVLNRNYIHLGQAGVASFDGAVHWDVKLQEWATQARGSVFVHTDHPNWVHETVYLDIPQGEKVNMFYDWAKDVALAFQNGLRENKNQIKDFHNIDQKEWLNAVNFD